jgi:hypothetical protein
LEPPSRSNPRSSFPQVQIPNGRSKSSCSGKFHPRKLHSALSFWFLPQISPPPFSQQELSTELLIRIEANSTSYFLGPVGISDPREFIAAESQRIPFKAALSKPSLWQDAFKNWPLPPIAGWRNWYKRVLADNSAKIQTWDSLRIAQCLELSLDETPKNEDLLIAACHFWSNGVNAFLFGHGPMSPTLADVYMITGLDVSGSVYPWDFKGSTRQTGVKPGSGYKFYIQNHMKDGPLGEVEYRAFLNMWLCRFIFCGKANEPTLNHIVMTTQLAGGKRIPLGKYLLGSVYHMLHQTISQMHTGQKISCVNGLWWFVQMWLQLHMHQIFNIDLNNRLFPSSSYNEGEVQVTRGCQTYGEAASQPVITPNALSQSIK